MSRHQQVAPTPGPRIGFGMWRHHWNWKSTSRSVPIIDSFREQLSSIRFLTKDKSCPRCESLETPMHFIHNSSFARSLWESFPAPSSTTGDNFLNNPTTRLVQIQHNFNPFYSLDPMGSGFHPCLWSIWIWQNAFNYIPKWNYSHTKSSIPFARSCHWIL